jgi:hypothetical protein
VADPMVFWLQDPMPTKWQGRSPIIDSSKLTFRERESLRAMLTRIANGGEGDPPESDDEPVIE